MSFRQFYINATVQQSVDHHAVTRPITPAEIRSSHTARTVTPVEIRNLEQQLYDLQSEETCLRYALKKYRPSYLRKSSPPLQSRDTSYAQYFSKDNARASENLMSSFMKAEDDNLYLLKGGLNRSDIEG